MSDQKHKFNGKNINVKPLEKIYCETLDPKSPPNEGYWPRKWVTKEEAKEIFSDNVNPIDVSRVSSTKIEYSDEQKEWLTEMGNKIFMEDIEPLDSQCSCTRFTNRGKVVTCNCDVGHKPIEAEDFYDKTRHRELDIYDEY